MSKLQAVVLPPGSRTSWRWLNGSYSYVVELFSASTLSVTSPRLSWYEVSVWELSLSTVTGRLAEAIIAKARTQRIDPGRAAGRCRLVDGGRREMGARHPTRRARPRQRLVQHRRRVRTLVPVTRPISQTVG